MNMSRWAMRLALGAGTILILWSPGCGHRADSKESVETPMVTVRAQAVTERSFPDVVTAQGRWRSSGEITANAPFAGTVDTLCVQLGDHVGKGQLLCRLITRESQAALRGAELLEREAHDTASHQEAARARELAHHDLTRVPLTAARDGVVIRLSARGGSEVAESAEILALVPEEAIVFEAHVSAADSPRLRVGQKAAITEQGRPERPATLQRILPAADPGDQSTIVWLGPEGRGSRPEIDRFGTSVITTGPPRRAPAIPDSALVQDDLTGETRVALITPDSRASWVRVTLGLRADGWHELKTPDLAPGSMVITDGQNGLPDSTRVKPAS
jgi:multidrug efflux pump subunit AcrA (membrane-fusion protein)